MLCTKASPLDHVLSLLFTLTVCAPIDHRQHAWPGVCANDRPDGALDEIGIGKVAAYLSGQRRRAVGIVAVSDEDCSSQIRIPACVQMRQKLAHRLPLPSRFLRDLEVPLSVNMEKWLDAQDVADGR